MSKMGRPLVMPVEDRCKEIYTAAEKLFGLKGFAHVTMAEIAAESGMSKKTLYVYFSDKKALLKALVSSSYVWSDQSLALDTEHSPVAALKRHLKLIAEYVLSERHLKLCRLAIAENFASDGMADTFYQMGITRSRQSLIHSIENIPLTQHRVKLELGLLADLLFGAVIGKKLIDALMANQNSVSSNSVSSNNVEDPTQADLDLAIQAGSQSQPRSSSENESNVNQCIESIDSQIASVVDALFIE